MPFGNKDNKNKKNDKIYTVPGKDDAAVDAAEPVETKEEGESLVSEIEKVATGTVDNSGVETLVSEETAASVDETPVANATSETVVDEASEVDNAAKSDKAQPSNEKKKDKKVKKGKHQKLHLPKESATETSASKQDKSDKPSIISKQFSFKKVVGFSVATLAAGLLIGGLVCGGIPQKMISGKTSLTEQDLSAVVATYTYNGKKTTVTAEDVMKATSGLNSMKTGDNEYKIPSTEDTIMYARNNVLVQIAKDRGIKVEDPDIEQYASTNLGTNDMETLATNFGMSLDDLKNVVRDSVYVQKLYDEVTKVDTSAADEVEPPTPPTDENASPDDKNADYGKYVADTLGDLWNSDEDTWAKTEGEVYDRLKDEGLSSKEASYNQAQAVYSAVVAAKTAEATEADDKSPSDKWSDFMTETFSNTSFSIGELTY